MASGVRERSSSSQAAAQYTAALQELYTTSDRARQDELVKQFYAPKAVFDDNVIRVHGQRAIMAQMHALPKLFSSISWDQEAVDVSADGVKQTINISTKQIYVLRKTKIALDVVTRLTLDQAGMIESHHDHWQGRYASWGFVKQATGSTSSLFLRMFGL